MKRILGATPVSGTIPRGGVPGLDAVLSSFEELRPIDGWTCDGGALVLSDMLDRAVIENMLRVGLYAPGTEDEEHHHWVEVGPFESGHTLLDPNGELRGEERRAVITAGLRARYLPRDEIASRGDREVMGYSSLWDWDEELLLEIWELTDAEISETFESAVADYVAFHRAGGSIGPG